MGRSILILMLFACAPSYQLQPELEVGSGQFGGIGVDAASTRFLDYDYDAYWGALRFRLVPHNPPAKEPAYRLDPDSLRITREVEPDPAAGEDLIDKADRAADKLGSRSPWELLWLLAIAAGAIGLWKWWRDDAKTEE